MMTLILIATLAVCVLALILYYNRLVNLRNLADNGWRQIDVQLIRRHDLIPNLVNTVKGTMKFEQETLTQVTQARNRAVSAAGMREKAAQEEQLTAALGRLFALAENYPQLRSDRNAMQLQEELVTTENRIGFARQFYNDIATQYNIATEHFPSNIPAAIFGFRKRELFEAPPGRKDTPAVDLRLK